MARAHPKGPPHGRRCCLATAAGTRAERNVPPAGQQGICLGSVGVPASAAIPTQRRHPRSAGLDMLHRLGMHNDVVEVLLAEGKVRAERHTLG